MAPAVARPQPIDQLPEQPAQTLELVVSPARYGGDLFSRYAPRLEPRKRPPYFYLHPDELQAQGLKDGDDAVIETDFGSFKLPVRSQPDMALGCVLVESSDAFPQLIPGAGLGYCVISAGGAHE